jgi:hypothetical protein
MNKKRLILISSLVVLVLVTCLAVVFRKDFDDCQEPAFQASSHFGQMPRRYFTITHLPQKSDQFTLRYLLSFHCNPYAVLSASRFTCELQSEVEPEKGEANHLISLIEGCERVGQ